MRRLVLISMMLITTTAALATDLPLRPARMLAYQSESWAGFYIGANGGYGWSQDQQGIVGGNQNGADAIAFGFVPSTLDTRGRGGLAGGQIGYNWQYGQVVAGIESDFDWANIKRDDSVTIPSVSLTTAGSTKLAWLGTTRGRLGYTITPTTLLYGTAGLAYGRVNSTTTFTLAVPPPLGGSAVADMSATKVGWAAGGGIEQMLGEHWSVKAEYLYTDLGAINGSMTANIGGVPFSFLTRQDLRYHTIKGGVNYRF